MAFDIIATQVMIWITTHDVFKNKAILASRSVSTGTLGRSASVAPITCPVALLQIFSNEFILVITVYICACRSV
jgi:hypothetical protein